MIQWLVESSVKRQVTVFMVAVATVAFGFVSLSRLTLNLLPDISYPSLTVRTEFPNAAPGEVENLVTKPVEEAVGVLRGLQEIHSVSRAGMSEVTLAFGWGADMDMLSMDIREKLDRLVLPDEVEKPIVLRYDPALDPIMRLSLTGSEDLIMMRYIAELEIKEDLEKIEGVASAAIKGGEEEEIQVNIEQGKLAAMGISPESLAQTLSAANINRPGGSLKSQESNYLVRTLNEYDSVGEIGQVTVTPMGMPAVRLSDVAKVVRGVKDREEITRVNGQEGIVLEVFKEGDANTVEVATGVKETMDRFQAKLPNEMKLNLLYDQSRFIVRALNEVRDALVVGGILAIAVLFLFLLDVRATVIIATAIPISVIATFACMYYFDVSLNIMSLGGLTLGIGMLVDGAIVVLESIHRRREQGLRRREASILGTSEVGGAVIASVLTTVAVFFPIVFVEGIAGQLFRDQSLTVTFSLLASLVVSLSFIPMLASLGRQAPPVKKIQKNPEKISKLAWLYNLYESLLRASLRLKWGTLFVAAAIFVGSLQLVSKLDQELIPAMTEGEFFFEVTLPEGTSLPATNKVIDQMEAIAMAHPDVEKVYASVGTRSVVGGLSLKNKDENLGQVNIVLKNRGDDALESQVAETLREAYSKIPNLDAKLGRPSFFSLKTAVELLFFGENLEQLQAYTLALKQKITDVEGVSDVRATLESGNPELNVIFDREKLARMGLSVRQVSNTLYSRVNGEVVSQFKENDRLIDIRMRNREEDRNTVNDIENMVVADRDGVPLTLKALASVDSARGPAEIHRIQQGRVAILSADLVGRSLGAVVQDIEAYFQANPPPVGIVFEMGGQKQEMETSFNSMLFAIGLAIFLVYLVMAATFENMIHPFVIMFTIPFALVGAILGLYLGGLAISVISMIGVIFLVGVVVNNAIVLVDAINRIRRDGMEKFEAVVLACKLRMRPILMTTMTTVLGLAPMAVGFGEGAELRQPLAVVVSAGLVVATALTLFVIPATYLIVPSKVRTYKEDEEMEAVLREAAAQTNATG